MLLLLLKFYGAEEACTDAADETNYMVESFLISNVKICTNLLVHKVVSLDIHQKVIGSLHIWCIKILEQK